MKVSKLQFFAALMVAALFSRVWSKEGWRRVRGAFRLWFRESGSGERASPGHAGARLDCCRRCPLFFTPLQTCGSPLRFGDADLGCWCYMPVKATMKTAQCWLDEEGIDDVEFSWQKHGL